MIVPTSRDVVQEVNGKLTTPQIRVWCRPARAGKAGDAWFESFRSFEEAYDFIKHMPQAEPHPLIAFDGYEFNLADYKDVPGHDQHLKEAVRHYMSTVFRSDEEDVERMFAGILAFIHVNYYKDPYMPVDAIPIDDPIKKWWQFWR